MHIHCNTREKERLTMSATSPTMTDMELNQMVKKAKNEGSTTAQMDCRYSGYGIRINSIDCSRLNAVSLAASEMNSACIDVLFTRPSVIPCCTARKA